jgi:hypothetical protein
METGYSNIGKSLWVSWFWLTADSLHVCCSVDLLAVTSGSSGNYALGVTIPYLRNL